MKIVLNDYFTLDFGKIGYLTSENSIAFAIYKIERKIMVVGQIFDAVNGGSKSLAVDMLCVNILCDAEYVTVWIFDFILLIAFPRF